jgi:hypothetical protein
MTTATASSCQSATGKTLWIGGTSCLAQTYINAFEAESLVLAGLESKAPSWVPQETKYVSLDLRATPESRKAAAAVKTTSPSQRCRCYDPTIFNGIELMILGVRAPLVTGDGNAHEDLLVGITWLLEDAVQAGVRHVLHISSVAACNHLESQVGVTEHTPCPPLHEYRGSYDRFKRCSEEIIEAQSGLHGTVHLRLSAVFSDSTSCVQCSALALQSRIGPATMPLRIDCNSGRNVAHAIRMLQQELLLPSGHGRQIDGNGDTNPISVRNRVYYYTRPTIEPDNMTYGDYLRYYNLAYNAKFRIVIPFVVITYLTMAVHWIVWKTPLHRIGILVSMDYLLQVAFREHTFDCSRFSNDFPNFGQQEETIYECFARRKRLLEGTGKK